MAEPNKGNAHYCYNIMCMYKCTFCTLLTSHAGVPDLLLQVLYSPQKRAEWEAICQSFVSSTSTYQVYPSFMNKPKIHLILHLVECMEEFGPTAAFNTER